MQRVGSVYNGLPKQSDSNKFVWYSVATLLSIFSVLPFYQEYIQNSAVYVAKYGILILFILTLLHVIRYKISGTKLVITLSLLSSVSLFSLFNTYNIASTITNILMYLIVGVLALLVFPKVSFEKFKSLITVFIIVTFIFVTVPSLMSIGDSSLYSNFGNRGRYLGVMHNANMLGRLALLGFLLSIRLWGLWKGFFKKSFLLFMIFSNTYLIYLSDSRASFIVLILVIGSLLVIGLYRFLPRYVFFSVMSLVSTVPLIVLLFIFNGNLINLELADVTSGRTEIWSNMFIGLSWYELIFGMGEFRDQGGHNGYLEIVRYFGLIGLMTWIPIILYLVFKKWRSRTVKNPSGMVGFGIILSFLIYHLVEGSLVSVANLASIYFWLELAQRDNQKIEIPKKRKRYRG